jgi:hypothetical protein
MASILEKSRGDSNREAACGFLYRHDGTKEGPDVFRE